MGLIKLKWPPIGYQHNERNFLASTRGLSEDRKRHLYQRRSYRKQISTPICLTYEKLNLMKSPTNALVSGNCDRAILNVCMCHQPNHHGMIPLYKPNRFDILQVMDELTSMEKLAPNYWQLKLLFVRWKFANRYIIM